MPRHVAIVEDEAAIRANYADMLKKHGYQVNAYADRKSAAAWWWDKPTNPTVRGNREVSGVPTNIDDLVDACRDGRYTPGELVDLARDRIEADLRGVGK